MGQGKEKGHRKNSWGRFCRLILVVNLKLINKFKEYFRVVKVAKKPQREELMSTSRNCLIGIGIIGAIGFIFYLISSALPGVL